MSEKEKLNRLYIRFMLIVAISGAFVVSVILWVKYFEIKENGRRVEAIVQSKKEDTGTRDSFEYLVQFKFREDSLLSEYFTTEEKHVVNSKIFILIDKSNGEILAGSESKPLSDAIIFSVTTLLFFGLFVLVQKKPFLLKYFRNESRYV